MKFYRKGKSFALFCVICGALCLATGLVLLLFFQQKRLLEIEWAHLSGVFCGLGAALLGGGAIYFYRAWRNPEKLKRLEVEQNDERSHMIRGKAGVVAFVVTTLLLAAMEITCFLIGERTAAMLALGVMFAHLGCFWAVQAVLNKKL